MSITVEIKGLRELTARLSELPQELKQKTSAIIENGAKNWVQLSKIDAPVDFGVLRNSITYKRISDLSFEIISGVHYSPYLEFGTITHAQAGVARAVEESGLTDIPPYALTFQGRKIRKTGGIKPHPYFFRQKPRVAAIVEAGLNKMIEQLK